MNELGQKEELIKRLEETYEKEGDFIGRFEGIHIDDSFSRKALLGILITVLKTRLVDESD